MVEGFIYMGLVMGLIMALVMALDAWKVGKKQKAIIQSIGSIEEIFLPKYLGGFENCYEDLGIITCAITESDFVFLTDSGKEIGKIHRNSVNSIILEDKSLVAQRLTATRILTLGIFSLAAPKMKKHKEYCIVFDYEDENVERQHVVFEFSGHTADELAKKAFNSLKKYKKPKLKRLKPNERKCPHCAEIIKAEAKVCRYCGRDV